MTSNKLLFIKMNSAHDINLPSFHCNNKAVEMETSSMTLPPQALVHHGTLSARV